MLFVRAHKIPGALIFIVSSMHFITACSREVALKGEPSVTVNFDGSEEANPPVRTPAPLPTAQPSPEPELEIEPEVVDAPPPDDDPPPTPTSPPTPTPTPTPTAGPEFTLIDIPVERSTLKPKTNLYLIVDNSYSMEKIQLRTAETLKRLMQSIAAEKLNVSIFLLTTTDMLVADPDPLSVTVSGKNHVLELGGGTSYTSGAKGNSVFSNMKLFEIIDNVPVVLEKFELNTTRTVYTSHDILQKASLFAGGGPVHFAADMTSEAANTLAMSAANTITTLGTSGSSIEQPIGTLYRIAQQMKPDTGERHAFAIVTNEDDTTISSFPLAVQNRLQFDNTAILRGYTVATKTTLQVEKYVSAQVADGVVKTPAYWQLSSLSHYERACNSPDNKCLPAGAKAAPCTQEHRDFMLQKLSSLNSATLRALPGGVV